MEKKNINEWVELPIENILEPNAKGIIISQGWSPQCEKGPSTSEKDWGVLKTTAIQNGFFLEEENKKLPAHLEPKPQHEVKKGDILITCAGPRNRCGIPCLVRKTRKKLMTSGKMYRFRINEKFAIPEFVEAYLLSQKAWKEIDAMKTGISDSGLNLTHSKFKKLIIPIPTVVTQLAIVAKIEELFSELDKGIEQLKTAQQQLKTYRQSVLKWAFEGKLTKGLNYDLHDLPDEHDLSIAAEPETEYKVEGNHGNQANQKNHGSEKGELPEGWKILPLKNLAELITDGDHQAPPKSKEGVPFITISNVNKTNNKIDFSDTFSVTKEYYLNLKANRKPTKGDILYTVTGSFGIPILIDFEKAFCFQRHIGLIRPLKTTNQKWLYYLLQSPNVFNQAKNTATGTAQKTVALSSLRNFLVPCCSIEEQNSIVQAIESRLSVADKMEESIIQSLQQAEALRQSILKKAFETGLV